MAFLCLFLSVCLSIVYILNGRFQRVAFLRSQKFQALENLGNRMYDKFEKMKVSAISRVNQEKKKEESFLGLQLRILVFVLGGAMLVASAFIATFAYTLLRVFFSSLLVSTSWKIDTSRFKQSIEHAGLVRKTLIYHITSQELL